MEDLGLWSVKPILLTQVREQPFSQLSTQLDPNDQTNRLVLSPSDTAAGLGCPAGRPASYFPPRANCQIQSNRFSMAIFTISNYMVHAFMPQQQQQSSRQCPKWLLLQLATFLRGKVKRPGSSSGSFGYFREHWAETAWEGRKCYGFIGTEFAVKLLKWDFLCIQSLFGGQWLGK